MPTETPQGMLNKGYGKLSSGTRVEILGGSSLDSADEELLTVRLANKPSYKLREQGFPADGIFDVPQDFVTLIRPRVDEVPSVARINRPNRVAKRIARELRLKNVQ